MKRIRFQEITGTQVNAANETVTIIGKDAKGSAEASIPMKALFAVANEAKRGKRSYQDRRDAGTLKSSAKDGWQEIALSDYKEIDVVDLPLAPEPCVAIVFDKNTERQIAFRLPAEIALLLAQNLISEIQKSKNQSPNQ